MTTPLNLGLDVFVAPTPSPRYDLTNEAAFRRGIELWCRKTVSALGDLNLNGGGGGGGGLTSPVGAADGGTGRTSLTSGSLLVGAGTSPVNFLAPGALGTVVRSTGSAWAASALIADDIGAGSFGTGVYKFTNPTDVSAASASLCALVVGGDGTGAHIAIDPNEIMAKGSATTTAELQLNADGGNVSMGKNLTSANVSVGLIINSGNNALANNTNASVEFQRFASTLWRMGVLGSLGTDGAFRLFDAVAGAVRVHITAAGIVTLQPTAGVTNTNAILVLNAGTNAGALDTSAYTEFQRAAVGRWRIGLLGSVATDSIYRIYDVSNTRTAFALDATFADFYPTVGSSVRIGSSLTTGAGSSFLYLNAGTNTAANNQSSFVSYQRGGTDLWWMGVIGTVATDGAWRLYDATGGGARITVALTTGVVTLAVPLGVASGGTGLATLTANALVLGNGTSAPTFLPPGSAGQVVKVSGALLWTAATLTAADVSGVPSIPVTVAQGGTSLLTLTANAVLIGNGTSAPTFVAPGAAGTVLKTSGALLWAALAMTAGDITAGSFPTGTFKFTDSTDISAGSASAGALVVGGDGTAAHLAFDANEIMAKGSATTAANLLLNADGGDVNVGGNLTSAATSVKLVVNCGTNAGALDTDAVTEYQRGTAARWRVGLLGSVAATSDFRIYDVSLATTRITIASGGAITLSGLVTLTTPLAVASGGTGLATLTSAALLVGAGTSAVTFVSPGAAGQVVRSNGSAWASATLSAADVTGIPTIPVTVAQGGTSLTTLTSAALIVGAGTSAVTFVAPGAAGTLLRSTGTVWAADGSPVTIQAGITTAAVDAILTLNAGTAAGGNNRDAYVLFERGGTDFYRLGMIGTVAPGGSFYLYDVTNTWTTLQVSGATWDFYPSVSSTVRLGTSLATSAAGSTVQLNAGTNAGALDRDAALEFLTGGTSYWRMGVLGSRSTDLAFRWYSSAFSQSIFAITAQATSIFITLGEFTSQNYSTVILLNAGTNAGANNKDSVFRIQRGFSNLWDFGVQGSIATDGALRWSDKVGGNVRMKLALSGTLTLSGNVSGSFAFNGTDDLSGATQVVMAVVGVVTTAATTLGIASKLTAGTAGGVVTYAAITALSVADANKGASSTITTLYGIKIENQTQGATNYALFTGTGLVSIGDTLITVASVAGKAGFRVPHGTAPSSPVNGDIWTTTAGLFARINGATVGPYT